MTLQELPWMLTVLNSLHIRIVTTTWCPVGNHASPYQSPVWTLSQFALTMGFSIVCYTCSPVTSGLPLCPPYKISLILSSQTTRPSTFSSKVSSRSFKFFQHELNKAATPPWQGTLYSTYSEALDLTFWKNHPLCCIVNYSYLQSKMASDLTGSATEALQDPAPVA